MDDKGAERFPKKRLFVLRAISSPHTLCVVLHVYYTIHIQFAHTIRILTNVCILVIITTYFSHTIVEKKARKRVARHYVSFNLKHYFRALLRPIRIIHSACVCMCAHSVNTKSVYAYMSCQRFREK